METCWHACPLLTQPRVLSLYLLISPLDFQAKLEKLLFAHSIKVKVKCKTYQMNIFK